MKKKIFAPGNFWMRLNYLYLLGVLCGVSLILTAALLLQVFNNELPCPLCYLQRTAFFGICFGIILSFRSGYSLNHTGYTMLFIIYLLIISIRQALLDIIPRPGHEWIGSPIFGIHLPVWSILISLILLIVYALKLSIIDHDDFMTLSHIENYPRLKKAGDMLSLYLIFLCMLNVISILLQCGIYICHTDYYLLLR